MACSASPSPLGGRRLPSALERAPVALHRRFGRWSYAAYLLHPLMLTVVVVCVRFSPWPPEVKLFLAVVLGVPLSYLVARVVTRVHFVSRVI